MKLNIVSGVVAMALALSTVAAFAQTGSSAQPNQGTAYNPAVKPPPAVFGNDSMGSAAAQKKPPGPQGVVGQYDMGGAQSETPSAGQSAAYKGSNANAQKSIN
jgi:hypothetical protein